MSKLYSINLFYRLLFLTGSFFLAFGLLNCLGQDDQTLPSKINGKSPFTNLPFNDDKDKVQFSIISDLWGGYRPGIIEDAVSKLELLQPQFVMSVGDLIDGKTYDTALIKKQWNEFNAQIEPLTMPFFYVVGNHDIANPVMETEWKKEFGRPYYYFIYKDVLFLSVDTQDNGGFDGISDQQIAYFKKGINDHPHIRWAFIFMHRPVWYDENKEGFEKIEALLKGYDYTVFSGHSHHYLYVNRNGTKYFTLASTGGKSFLYGPKYGWFDHITWVTLSGNRDPKIINIALNGLFKEDLVNEITDPIDSMLVYQKWLIAPSYVAEKQFEDRIHPSLIFKNSTAFPLKITGNLSNDKRYKITPEKIDFTLQPHSKETREITVRSATDAKLDLSRQQSINFILNGSVKYDTTLYELPAQKQLLLTWKYVLPEIDNAKKKASTNFVNGDTIGFVSIRHPEYLEDHWYWSGPEDGLIQFKLTHDTRYIYLLAFISDNQLVIDHSHKKDLLYVDLEDKAGNARSFIINPLISKSTISADGKGSVPVKDLKLETVIKKGGVIKIKLRIPIKDVVKPDRSFRFNIGYHDQDNHPESHGSSIFWKPRWGTKADYNNSGTFILDYKN